MRTVGVKRPLAVCLSLFFLYLLFSEIPILTVESDGGSLNEFYVFPLGSCFETRYIHSLELTPVEDLYVPVDGEIWLWEERVKSHNAGLPTEPGINGFFLSDQDWMRFFGGRYSRKSYLIRVGSGLIGRNELRLCGGAWLELYDTCPGKRLLVTLNSYPLVLAWRRFFE